MSEKEVAPAPREGGLLRGAIGRPVTVIVGAVLVVLFGALTVVDLPIQLTPDISVPTLSISTAWPGASPTEIEREILEPQEDALKSLEGLREMTSTARSNRGQVSLEFELGTDIDDALVRTTNALQEVGDYPDAADAPVVETSDDTGPPLAVIAVRHQEGEPVEAYRTWVEDEILPRLQRIPGVGDIRLLGGRDTIAQVDFAPEALAARGLSIPAVAQRLQTELRDVSGGDVTIGRRRLLVRTMAVEPEPDALERVVVAAGPDGTPIRLGDVATVRFGLREATGVAMSDDRPSLVMLLSREAGSNVLEVTEDIRAETERLDEERFQPEGLRIEVLSDQVGYIRGALDLVQQNLLLGAGLAILVLLLFLRSFGASAIVSVAIPVSVFGTALGMNLLGRTVNVVSLAGVTFAIGMVLDNSIVALESIDTWRGRLSQPRAAAHEGIREVWGAIVASTFTTAAVFIPVIGWEDEVGQLLKDVAVAVSFAVGTSLLVSVLVIPALAAKLPPREAPEEKKRPGWLRWLDARGEAGRRRVSGAAASLIAKPWRGGLVVVGAVVAALMVVWSLLPPLEYLPAGNRNLLFGILTPPPGTSVEELEDVGRQVQGEIAEHIDREVDGVPAVKRSFFVGSTDRLFAGAVADDPDRVKELLGWLRGVQSSIPGYFAFTTQASLFGRRGGGRTVEVQITGADLGDLVGAGGALFGAIRGELEGAQVRPVPSLDPGTPELRFHPRRGAAAPLQTPTDTLGLMVDAVADGAIVGELSPPGQPRLDVVLRAVREGEAIEDRDAILSAPVVAGSGEVVPLGVLADAREELGPITIQRIERRRALTLDVSPPETLPLETAIERIRRIVDEQTASGTLPPGVRVEIAGAAGDLERAKDRFADVLLLALVISFLLLSALFEDFLAPVVVLVTVPLAAAGGIGALRLVDATLSPQPLDLMTALGFLILLGVVVNNAILVVDGALARLREGDELVEAVRAAVANRVRPILMTTLTSLAGLTPMVLVPGSGSELYRGVGAIVLGGLTLATVLTLFVVPSLFGLIWRVRMRAR